MKSLLISLFLLSPFISNSQVYNVYQIVNHDTISFHGNLIKLPPVQNVIHCDYLVELEGNWLVTSMTLDIATSGIQVFGYATKSDGQFHLMLTTNSTDQTYLLGDCVQYLLIRLGPGVWQSVNIDFGME